MRRSVDFLPQESQEAVGAGEPLDQRRIREVRLGEGVPFVAMTGGTVRTIFLLPFKGRGGNRDCGPPACRSDRFARAEGCDENAQGRHDPCHGQEDHRQVEGQASEQAVEP